MKRYLVTVIALLFYAGIAYGGPPFFGSANISGSNITNSTIENSTIDNSVIGDVTPAQATFTDVTATDVTADSLIILNPGVDDTIVMKDSSENIDIFLNTGGDSYFTNNLAVGKDAAIVNIDTPKIRYTDAHFVDEFWNGARPEWATDVTTGYKSATSQVNGQYLFATGATPGDEESFDWNNVRTFLYSANPIFEVEFLTGSIADLEIEVGLKGSDPVNNHIKIVYDYSVQNTWYLQTTSGGSTTTQGGPLVGTGTTTLRFEVEGTQVRWYVNGTHIGVIATNIPTGKMEPFLRVETEAASNKLVYFDYVKIWQDR